MQSNGRTAERICGRTGGLRRQRAQAATRPGPLLRVLHRSRRLLKRGNPIFFWNQFVIVELVEPLLTHRRLGLEPVLAAPQDIEQLCAQEPGNAERFRRRVRNGEECVMTRKGPRIVARMWCERGGRMFETNGGVAFEPPRTPAVWGHDLYIDPNYRMRGDFVALMETAALPRNGADRAAVYGEIHVLNERSLAAHRRLGFQIIRRITFVMVLGVRVYVVRHAEGGVRITWRFGHTLPRR